MSSKIARLDTLIGANDPAGKILAGYCLAALLANLGTILAFVLPRLGKLSFLRLHYTVEMGVDWAAEWWKLFVFPVVGTVFFFINGLFSGILARKHRMLGLMTLGATAVIETLLAGSGVIAVLLNR